MSSDTEKSHSSGTGLFVPADAVLGCVQRFADRPFLIDASNDRIVSYEEVHRLACRMADKLRRSDVGKGDRIAIVLPNSMEFVVLYFGCLYIGAVAVPINPQLNRKDIEYILKASGAALVVCSLTTRALISELTVDEEKTGLLCLKLSANAATDETGYSDWSLEDSEGTLADGELFKEVDATNLFTIHFTSGTTGLPKGVSHRIENLMRAALAFNQEVGITPDSRLYHVLPMSYMAGFLNTLLCPFLAGASVVIMRPFDARLLLEFWEAPVKYDVNTLWLVPTILSALLRVDRGQKGPDYCRTSVDAICVGTAPLPGKVKEDFEQRYGVEVLESYGLSETLFVTANSKSVPRLPGSVGRALPGVTLKVMTDAGGEAPVGVNGEIWIQTPFLMEGYLNLATRSPNRLETTAWFPSGDLGHLVPSGHLFITGRKKDLIIRGGVNISPQAIEETIRTHPSIAQVAVVGLPHELQGEEVVAVVKLEQGYSLESVRPMLETLCRNNLSAFSVPAKFIEVDEFPMSATGKVQKAKLRDWLASRAVSFPR